MEPAASFAHYVCLIAERSCGPWQDERGVEHPRLTLEDRATQCYEWATQHQTTQPALAEDLRYQARAYANESQKVGT